MLPGMTIHVVGLGPGDPSLLTRGAADLLSGGLPVVVLTRRHPSVAEFDTEGSWPECPETEDSARLADHLLGLFRDGDGVFAVPGHPRTGHVWLTALESAAEAAGVALAFHAGLSPFDLVAVRPGIDTEGLQFFAGRVETIDPARPALLTREVADGMGRLPRSVTERYPPDASVMLFAALGTSEESREEGRLAELEGAPRSDWDVVYLPPVPATGNVRTLEGLAGIVAALNAPGGCPWDNDQTHESLRRYLLEEAYEALQAIDDGDPAALVEELGDVLLQVFMHAEVARREGTFSVADITAGIGIKLVRRHPHVFGEGTAVTAAEVETNWEQLKQQEKPAGSILDGVPVALPALAASQSLQGRARRVGFDWPGIEGPLDKLNEEIGEFARANGDADREDEFGDILFVIANIADHLEIDAEQALRRANAKFRQRFAVVESFAKERGIDMRSTDLAGLDALWDEAKTLLAAQQPQL